MKLINIYDAKTNLSKLINAVIKGEKIAISKHGVPLVTLAPYKHSAKKKRSLGFLKDKGYWVGDEFDDPLPDKILKAFNKDIL